MITVAQTLVSESPGSSRRAFRADLSRAVPPSGGLAYDHQLSKIVTPGPRIDAPERDR